MGNCRSRETTISSSSAVVEWRQCQRHRAERTEVGSWRRWKRRAVMHCFRLHNFRYILLGLLLYIRSAFCRTCVNEFDDIPSLTVGAAIVFEGKAHREIKIPGRERYRQVRFRVTDVLKGNLLPPDDEEEALTSRGGAMRTILIGEFGPALAATANICDRDAAIIAPRIELDARYIVFLRRDTERYKYISDANDSVNVGGGNRNRNTARHAGNVSRTESDLDIATNSSSNVTVSREVSRIVYRLSARPFPATASVLEDVRKFNCSTCARSPRKITLTPTVNKKTVGGKIRLQCRTTGKPSPVVTWFKDDVPIQHSDQRTRIRKTKRGWQIEIRRLEEEDSGLYRCRATNVLGSSDSDNVTMTVSHKRDHVIPPHSTLCRSKSFCLNGGTCYVMTSLNKNFCQCVNNYMGTRCEEKNTGLNTLMTLEPDGTYGKRKRSPTFRHRRHYEFPNNNKELDFRRAFLRQHNVSQNEQLRHQ